MSKCLFLCLRVCVCICGENPTATTQGFVPYWLFWGTKVVSCVWTTPFLSVLLMLQMWQRPAHVWECVSVWDLQSLLATWFVMRKSICYLSTVKPADSNLYMETSLLYVGCHNQYRTQISVNWQLFVDTSRQRVSHEDKYNWSRCYSLLRPLIV